MNRAETTRILAILETAYPAFYRGQNAEQRKNAIDLWTQLFDTDSYQVVLASVHSMISTRTSGYPPTVGEIKDVMHTLTTPKEMTPMEAWGYVYRAIRRGVYYAEEDWEKMPPQVKNAVTPVQIRAWAMDEDFNEGVASSNFMRSYQTMQKRQTEWEKVPQSVKDLLSGKTSDLRVGMASEYQIGRNKG